MNRPRGTFAVSGVGQAVLDLEGISIPLSGEVRLDGMVRQAIVTVKVPNALVGVLTRAIDRPVEQIPLYRPELIRLQIKKG